MNTGCLSGSRGFEVVVGCGDQFDDLDEAERRLLEEASKILPEFLKRECRSVTPEAPIVVRIQLVAYPAYRRRDVLHSIEQGIKAMASAQVNDENDR